MTFLNELIFVDICCVPVHVLGVYPIVSLVLTLVFETCRFVFNLCLWHSWLRTRAPDIIYISERVNVLRWDHAAGTALTTSTSITTTMTTGLPRRLPPARTRPPPKRLGPSPPPHHPPAVVDFGSCRSCSVGSRACSRLPTVPPLRASTVRRPCVPPCVQPLTRIYRDRRLPDE